MTEWKADYDFYSEVTCAFRCLKGQCPLLMQVGYLGGPAFPFQVCISMYSV